jgi:hypothetical protein
MPTNPSSTANLPCEQCGYLNEPERVYCHNCGAKLDRSLLPKAEEKHQESPEKARKRISKMTNPQASWFWREVKMLFKVAIYAAMAAVVILIAQAPDGVPDGKKEPTMRLVSSDMMEALESPTPRALSFSEDEVNQYLKQMLKAKDGAIPGVEFTRAYVNLRAGAIRLNSENSVWGYPVFSGVDYQLEVKEGKFTATVIGGSFGRLSVDPQLMRYAEMGFESLQTSLQRERKQMEKMQSVKVEDKRIDLVTKGTAGVR